ncbi:MAG TPA: hypothetical protein VM597_10520, partial [Gemmataceae bacterium]|nr:hypothetical protein [Gemmataceae bacterium]
MSQNRTTLLTVAAELRTIGYSWAAIAEEVNRKPETCQKWPARYPDDWDAVYREAQRKRFDETSAEAHGVFKVLLRSMDDKVRLKAVDVWLKCGAGGYGHQGKLVTPGPA